MQGAVIRPLFQSYPAPCFDKGKISSGIASHKDQLPHITVPPPLPYSLINENSQAAYPSSTIFPSGQSRGNVKTSHDLVSPAAIKE
ncbi:hypothetical protein EI77_04167 [Prosthecobacter fusiformis]|uniref:Uncharacterized protein n=1 Tax=Prosthecobacter fusiformis TaxID=48464 RepID=A0A4R7RJL0_9BACT|nr:hypothetical protein EI77_04167 [Prosthecobacter fusiformis]